MSTPQLIHKNGLRILCIAEIRGELSLFNRLGKQYNASIIIHTGNFGFFDNDSINRIHESYLRHIAALSPLLEEEVVNKVSELSKASGEYVEHSDENGENLKKILSNSSISELPLFISGEKKLEFPVYTIHGASEDSFVINKFRDGTYRVPNLYIVDENKSYYVDANDSRIFLCGLGGAFALPKLFTQGTIFDMIEIDNEQKENDDSNKLKLKNDGDTTNNNTHSNTINTEDGDYLIPASGDPGNMWITMVQIGKLIKTVDSNFNVGDIRIFLSHPSPSREGLLGHLAVFLKMDYTISSSLHFLYPTSCNELSICPSFEYYKSKFSDSRNQLATVWKNVKDTVGQAIGDDSKLTELMTLALDSFDRIPVSRSVLSSSTASSVAPEEIIPLSLPSNSNREINSSIIRQQNDSYYIGFQNMWHFNLCDVSAGLLLLNVLNGRFKMECFSEGYDFTYRKNVKEENLSSTPSTASSEFANHGSNSNGANLVSTENSPSEKPRYYSNRGSRGSSNGYRGGRGRGRGASSRGRGFSRSRGNS